MTANVGIIGLGVLGQPVAERLIAQGFSVAAYDIRTERTADLAKAGARPCEAPAEVAHHSDFVITLVADQPQTEEVILGADGLLTALREGTVVIIGSTLSPAAVQALAGAVDGRGGETLDAPISGGYLAAREGTLSMMIGGRQAVLDRAMPVLQAIATRITRAGTVGAGQAAKLAHQLVFSLNVMALLEGLALGTAAGVEPATLRRIFGDGLADSAVLQRWENLGPRWKGMLKPAAPGEPPPNMRKDLHLALELARELGVNLYLGTQASLIADAGVAAGHQDAAL